MKQLKLVMLMMVMFAGVSFGQVFGTNCPTLEEQQAAYNRKLAAGIVVVNTSSQQLQCHYNQLATYWQQLHTSNQQKAKDEQQKNKDIQQVQKDQQQLASDKALAIREAELLDPSYGYDELNLFIEAILPLLGSCDENLKTELNRIHTNRSGGGDLTNPGGGGNLNGFDNPHMVH